MRTMQKGELVVAGHQLIKHVNGTHCEHLAEVDGSIIRQDKVEFAGYVPVWRLTGIPDGSGKPAGAGLALVSRPRDEELVQIYRDITNAAHALQTAPGAGVVLNRLAQAIHRLHVYATT